MFSIPAKQLIEKCYITAGAYPNELFKHKKVAVSFDDGQTVELTRKELIYNSFIWFMFVHNGGLLNVPVTSDLSVHHVVRKRIYPKNLHVKLLEKIFTHIKNHLNLVHYKDFEFLVKKAYETSNIIYNHLVQDHVASSIVSIDIFDFVGVVEDPVIKDIHKLSPQSGVDVANMYDMISERIRTGMSVENKFILSIMSDCLAMNKAMQCVGPRGVIADIDTTVYMKPAEGGFIRGLRSLYDLTLESRAMAKSLMAQNADVSTSQYASRRAQLVTMVVERVVHGDCGSQDYFEFLVGPKDLRNIEGSYYLKKDNTLDYIRRNDEDLIGTTVKLRTSIGCQLHNPHHVCSTCFGRAASNIPDHSNIGHTSVAEVMTELTQSLLSLKHLLMSVSTSGSYINPQATDHLYSVEDRIYLKPGIDKNNVSLMLPSRDMTKIVDLMNIQDDEISPVRIGEFSITGLLINKGKSVQKHTFEVISDIAKVVLSKEFVMYIKVNGYNVYGRDYFSVPLDKFDMTMPVFNVPAREAGLIQFVNKVISIIDRTVETPRTPEAKLSLLYDTVSKRLNIHICMLAIIVYSLTAREIENQDYRLARNVAKKKTAPLRTIIANRTLGPLLSFEKGTDHLFDKSGSAYISKYKQGHPMDVFFMPSIAKSSDEGE